MTSHKLPLPIHHQARQSIKKLGLPGPIKKYFSSIDCSVDLSKSTNPHSPYWADYPDIDSIELKKLYLQTLHAPDITPKNVLFTVGSVDGMDLILRGFAEPFKDIICLTDPTFSAYEHWATLYDLPIQKVPLEGENFDDIIVEKNCQIDPKIFILCNPNNPTGTQISLEKIEKICKALPGLIIVDEAYIEFSNQPSAVKILHKYENLIILRTLSKGWGMAGARCGIILASEPIICTLFYVQAPFAFSKPAQDAVFECLTHPSKVTFSWELIKKDRDYLVQEISNLPCVQKVYPSQTNFVMVTLKDCEQTLRHLRNHRIYVIDNRSIVPDTIKISISTASNNQTLIDALRQL